MANMSPKLGSNMHLLNNVRYILTLLLQLIIIAGLFGAIIYIKFKDFMAFMIGSLSSCLFLGIFLYYSPIWFDRIAFPLILILATLLIKDIVEYRVPKFVLAILSIIIIYFIYIHQNSVSLRKCNKEHNNIYNYEYKDNPKWNEKNPSCPKK
jgi:hypothetical protein